MFSFALLALLVTVPTTLPQIEAKYALLDALSDYERSLADLERAIGTVLPGERKAL